MAAITTIPTTTSLGTVVGAGVVGVDVTAARADTVRSKRHRRANTAAPDSLFWLCLLGIIGYSGFVVVLELLYPLAFGSTIGCLTLIGLRILDKYTDPSRVPRDLFQGLEILTGWFLYRLLPWLGPPERFVSLYRFVLVIGHGTLLGLHYTQRLKSRIHVPILAVFVILVPHPGEGPGPTLLHVLAFMLVWGGDIILSRLRLKRVDLGTLAARYVPLLFWPNQIIVGIHLSILASLGIYAMLFETVPNLFGGPVSASAPDGPETENESEDGSENDGGSGDEKGPSPVVRPEPLTKPSLTGIPARNGFRTNGHWGLPPRKLAERLDDESAPLVIPTNGIKMSMTRKYFPPAL